MEIVSGQASAAFSPVVGDVGSVSGSALFLLLAELLRADDGSLRLDTAYGLSAIVCGLVYLWLKTHPWFAQPLRSVSRGETTDEQPGDTLDAASEERQDWVRLAGQ